MTDRKVTHASFTLERVFDAAPARVFAAFSTVEAKARWFTGGSDWTLLEREFDFRIGGRERAVGQWTSGVITAFNATYHEILEDQRIVYAYGMTMDGVPISVSLATIQLRAEDGKTRVIFTEQGAFFDQYEDNGSREDGTRFLLDKLGASLN